MERCPRCSTVVEAGWGYCPVCGRTRVLESLQVPITPTEGQHQAFRASVVLLSLWLVVTLAVAVFREFKAVRDGERLYAEGQVEESWGAVGPFVETHREHAKALFLCGKTTIRLGLHQNARQCLDWLAGASPELKEELTKDYTQVLAGQARGLGCNPDGVQALLTGAEMLGGGDFVDSVTAGLDTVVETCRASEQQWVLSRIAEILVARQRGMDMINRGYVPVIRKAVAEGRRSDARWLAYQARIEIPDGTEAVKAALISTDESVGD
jgi:hypothetical protein